MTQERPQPDPDGMATNQAQPDTVGSNGTHADAAVAIAETTEAAVNEAPSGVADVSPADVDSQDDGTAFLAQLARAMQETAGAERKRIDEDIERRRAAHLETIHARRESEATSIRDLAADDLKAIDDWAQAEHQRINEERKQRATALQADLDSSLAEHASKIDTEIADVEAAIAAYRTDVDAYFATMNAATDPVEIAKHAAQRPVFPDLAAVSSAAMEAAPTTAQGQAPIPVMDQEAAADPATAWARWNETGALPEVTVPPGGPETPVAETAPGGLLQSVPVTRPYGAYRESSEGR
jgi:hypothetical protein